MMSTVEIDDDLLTLLNQMKEEGETINDVLRKILVSINTENAQYDYITEEEFEKKSDEILERYNELLIRLAE